MKSAPGAIAGWDNTHRPRDHRKLELFQIRLKALSHAEKLQTADGNFSSVLLAVESGSALVIVFAADTISILHECVCLSKSSTIILIMSYQSGLGPALL